MSAKSKVTTKRCFIVSVGYGQKIVLPFTKASMDLLEQLEPLQLHDTHYVDGYGYVYYRSRKPVVDVEEIEIFDEPEVDDQLEALIKYFKPKPDLDELLAEAAE